jgi:large conductance mechanosensitive channel
MGMLKEFKDFAMRGNVVDLAVGLTVGAGFGKIVSSLVNDIIMPPIGMLMGNVNFTDLYISLDPALTKGMSLVDAKKTSAAIIGYGVFINTLIDFLIVAFCMFLVVRAMNRLKTLSEIPPPATTKDCPFCTSTIPIKAIRCPQCTAELPAAAEPAQGA